MRAFLFLNVTAKFYLLYKYYMIFDLHNDFYTADETKSEFISKLDELYGCVAVFWATRQEKLISNDELIKDNKVLFAIEDLHFYNDTIIERIERLRPAYCSLTWNYDNLLAGGTFGDGDLTSLGKEAIRFLESIGSVVDCAHLNEKSFYSVIDTANKVIVSHTCVSELKEHRRNINKGQIKLIAEKKGIIGLTPLTFFTRDERIETFVEAIDFVVSTVGDKFVAVGTDFNGSTDFPSWLGSYLDFNKLRYALEKKGYNSSSIDKIFFNNALRFFK